MIFAVEWLPRWRRGRVECAARGVAFAREEARAWFALFSQTASRGGSPCVCGGGQAFVEFHGRFKKAELILKSIPSRPAPASVMKTRGYNGREALSKDYLALRAELEKVALFPGRAAAEGGGSWQPLPHSPHSPSPPCTTTGGLLRSRSRPRALPRGRDRGHARPGRIPLHVL